MVKLEVDEDFFLLIHISIVSKQNEKTSAFTYGLQYLELLSQLEIWSREKYKLFAGAHIHFLVEMASVGVMVKIRTNCGWIKRH